MVRIILGARLRRHLVGRFSCKDLILIEEAFERMMLDYDRVFACMGVPACLWRRTGEIYKGNREFVWWS